jgi:hypothetical protein
MSYLVIREMKLLMLVELRKTHQKLPGIYLGTGFLVRKAADERAIAPTIMISAIPQDSLAFHATQPVHAPRVSLRSLLRSSILKAKHHI